MVPAASDEHVTTLRQTLQSPSMSIFCSDAIVVDGRRVDDRGTRAFAQDAGDVGTARTLGTEGLRLAESGNCEAAIEKLARAERDLLMRRRRSSDSANAK